MRYMKVKWRSIELTCSYRSNCTLDSGVESFSSIPRLHHLLANQLILNYLLINK